MTDDEKESRLERSVNNVWSRVLARFVAPLMVAISLAVGGWMITTLIKVNDNMIKLYGWMRLLYYRVDDMDKKGIPNGMDYGHRIVPDPPVGQRINREGKASIARRSNPR